MNQDTTTCAIEGCGKKRIARGWCNRHWKSWRADGDPNAIDERKAEREAKSAAMAQGGTYQCSKCGVTKPVSDYHKDAKSQRGHHSSCKICRTAQVTAYYHENKEERTAYFVQYRANNVEALRKRDLERYERDKEKRIALVLEREHIRRALKKDNGWERGVTRPALRKIHGDDCPYCGITMTFTPFNGYEPERATIEHIMPLSRGGSHTFDNVCLCCWQCNVRKNAKTLDEWDVLDDGERIREQSVQS